MPDNVELVRRSYEAWNNGDLESFIEFLDPDVEIDLRERVLNPGTYQGVDGFRRWARELDEVWSDWKMEPEEILEGPKAVFIEVRAHGRGRGSGVEIDQLGYNVTAVRNGKAVRVAFFYDRGKALRAAGLD